MSGLRQRNVRMFSASIVEELEYEMIDDRVSLSDPVAALNIPLKRTNVSAEEPNENVELDVFLQVGKSILHLE